MVYKTKSIFFLKGEYVVKDLNYHGGGCLLYIEKKWVLFYDLL